MNQPSPNPEDQISASSIFLEMMRQQAAQQQADTLQQYEQAQTPPAVQEETPPTTEAPPTPVVANLTEAVVTPAPAHQQERDRLRQARQQRRQERRRKRAVSAFGGVVRSMIIVLVSSTVTATIFTWWTDPQFIAPEVRDTLSVALATATRQVGVILPTELPQTPNYLQRIGIVSGHRGPEDDPGAVCPDGLTEREVNFNVATKVIRNLQNRGYTVDLLDEFDPRLAGYTANALVSIHANTCVDYGQKVSGYLISTADARIGSGNDQLLVECVGAFYGQQVPIERRYGFTRDMTDYHIFREINQTTPATIIELGFLYSDREVLTTKTDEMAQGITDGILCFLDPSDPNILATLTAPTAPPPPTALPLPTITATP